MPLELYLFYSQFFQFFRYNMVISLRAGVEPLALIKLKNAYSKRCAYMLVIVMRKYSQT